MITYEVKLTVQEEVEKEWIHWMRTQHVPDVIATGLLKSYQILKPTDKDQVYLFHYNFESEEDFKKYESEFADKLRQDVKDKYEGKFTGERTLYHWI